MRLEAPLDGLPPSCDRGSRRLIGGVPGSTVVGWRQSVRSPVLVTGDGRTWQQESAPWPPRGAVAVWTSGDSLFMSGGKYSTEVRGETVFAYYNDVWQEVRRWQRPAVQGNDLETLFDQLRPQKGTLRPVRHDYYDVGTFRMDFNHARST